MQDYFARFAPFVQQFIYQSGWQALRPLQNAAAEVLFETDDHLLLAAQTAGGKTEAAFFPALTLLAEHPSDSVGILYVSPLKALINDQFGRMEQLLEDSGIPVTRWHGDVSQGEKEKLTRHPSGVLQITPESLEGMLMHRKSRAIRLFSDLKFIIIDEVHYFMNSDRGTQLLSILERLERLTGVHPRRIGLSATLGDAEQGKSWLSAGTGRKTAAPDLTGEQQTIRLAAEHFTLMHPEMKDGDLSSADLAYFDFLMKNTYGKRCILFGNAKMELERVISTLRELCALQQKENVYLIHHGSLSASLRENTELLMKHSDLPTVTGATVTLELGIDVGDMERIVQLSAPFSVSSFVQRLGRSGRRGKPAEMLFCISEYQHLAEETILQVIDWDFLRCVAICQLYLEERFIEPARVPKKPFSLLYHQLMSELCSAGEASVPYLASRLLTLHVFQSITKEEFMILLRHLLKEGQLQKTERGGLMVGVNAEHLLSDHQFLAVFDTPEFWSVRWEAEEIGTVLVKFPVGERFALAGRTWEVTSQDEASKSLQVTPIQGRSSNLWEGGGFRIHTKILQKIQEILCSDQTYSYLLPEAAGLLSQYRSKAAQTGLGRYTVLPIGGVAEDGGKPTYHDKVTGMHKTFGSMDFAVLPWLGTEEFLTLSLALTHMGLHIVAQRAPYWLVVRCEQGKEQVEACLRRFKEGRARAFFPWKEQELEEKFSEYLPDELKAIHFNTDFLDFPSAEEHLQLSCREESK